MLLTIVVELKGLTLRLEDDRLLDLEDTPRLISPLFCRRRCDVSWVAEHFRFLYRSFSMTPHSFILSILFTILHIRL